MTVPQAENKQELQNNQQQSETIVESSPNIKSEENQANWKTFREQMVKDRHEKAALKQKAEEETARAKALQEALSAVVNKPQAQSQTRDEEESEDERLNRLVDERLRKKEQEYQQRREEEEQKQLPYKLKSQFNDFDRVCSDENIDYLEYHYPEVASAYKQLPDSIDKWSNIYKAIKRFVPNPDSKKDMQKAERNLQKPQSPSSTANAATNQAAPAKILDEQTRAANWARMQRAMKGLSD